MMNFCTNCGTKLKKEYNFCTQCGFKIDKQKQELINYLKSQTNNEKLIKEMINDIYNDNITSKKEIDKKRTKFYNQELIDYSKELTDNWRIRRNTKKKIKDKRLTLKTQVKKEVEKEVHKQDLIDYLREETNDMFAISQIKKKIKNEKITTKTQVNSNIEHFKEVKQFFKNKEYEDFHNLKKQGYTKSKNYNLSRNKVKNTKQDKIDRIKQLSKYNIIGANQSKRTYDELERISPIGYQDNIELENKIVMITLMHENVYRGIYECSKTKENLYRIKTVSNVYGLEEFNINTNSINSQTYLVYENKGKSFKEYIYISKR